MTGVEVERGPIYFVMEAMRVELGHDRGPC